MVGLAARWQGVAKGDCKMPRGDAARIHRYAGQLVQNARANGEKVVVIHVRDIRDALGLSYGDDVAFDICRVLETHKFRRENGVLLDVKSGPKQGLGTDYVFDIR